MSELLPAAELRDLTGRARGDAQRRWLAEQGIPYRADGARTLVSRHHVRGWLAGAAPAQSREVDLSGVR